MKIEKLPSGSYRVRTMHKGKRYSLTFDKRPTKDEIASALAERISVYEKPTSELPFKTAAKMYVDSKRNVLSPSTIRDYERYPNRMPEWFRDILLGDLMQGDINRLINELAKDKSPKTVRNYHGFISAILGVYKPELHLKTKLPAKVKREPYLPTDEDVRRILEAADGTDFYIPLSLACYGLRRSEICALSPLDIKGTAVTINKALVRNSSGEYVIKNTTKTDASTRTVDIPAALAMRIRAQGYIMRSKPAAINRYLGRTIAELGIPHFTLHMLRHYFASRLHEMGVSDADILALGGWETDHIMKTVYRHSTADDTKRKKISSDLAKVIGL